MTRGYRAAYAVTVALYGVVMIVANARNGVFSSTYTREWVLFGGASDIPGDFGRNVFGGSVALGVLVVVFAGLMWQLAGRSAAVAVGGLAVAFSVVLLVLYDADGNLLAARPAPLGVLAAAGVVLISSGLDDRTDRGRDRAAR